MTDDTDPWTQFGETREDQGWSLGITRQAARPLDRQQRAWPKRHVPESLSSLLAIDAEDGLLTYALLDGALIPDLTDRLENTGLEHLCLFKGVAADELGESAPWLVRLEGSSELVRALLTRSDAPWHVWDNQAALFLRSGQPIEAICAHFRRFTQFRDSQGRWVWFRFWSAPVMACYLRNHAPEADPYIARFLDEMTLVLPEPLCDSVTIAQVQGTLPGRTGPVSPQHWPEFEGDMARVRHQLYLEGLDRKMCRKLPSLAELPAERRLSGLRRMAQSAAGVGLREVNSVERYVIACMLLNGDPSQDPRFEPAINSGLHDVDRSIRILHLAKQLTKETT
jgi:hypothetical protein